MIKIFFPWLFAGFFYPQATKIGEENFPYDKIGNRDTSFSLKSGHLDEDQKLLNEKTLEAEKSLESRRGRILLATPCSPGNYDNSGTCSPCGTMCAYCDDNGNCLGCQNNSTMIISSNKKDCECKDATATAGTCICPQANPWFDGSTCQTCESGSYYGNSGCTACSTSGNIRVKSIIKSKKAPSCCPDGKYLDSSTSKCSAFDANCELCEDGAAGHCDKCSRKWH
ncbi:unnamed protein product [Blepharisma stoltei]|uniref:Tyrosine-protein kinase ephrin type A/B receptor-like domain-containing protein n=1 Tax=Blepharisma stoltei TaxID=1481888 RepID=A0AAU9JYY8_9CILI|nr:unnamed protein product [Blepharisma stoltei]